MEDKLWATLVAGSEVRDRQGKVRAHRRSRYDWGCLSDSAPRCRQQQQFRLLEKS